MLLKTSLVLLSLATASQAIINGQRYSIQRAPFIFHGQGFVKHQQTFLGVRFTGLILTHRFILTLNGIQTQAQNITITVGTANVNEYVGKKFHVGATQNDNHLCIYEITDGPILFGDGLQKATLPRSLSWTPKKELVVVGWGSVNWYNVYSANLHFKLGYTDGEIGDVGVDEKTEFFYLTAKNKKAFPLGEGNYGAAAFDDETGEVLGLCVAAVTQKVKVKVVHLLPHVVWIDRTIRNWASGEPAGPQPEDPTAATDEDGNIEEDEDPYFKGVTKAYFKIW